jgi:hypothetical protein
MKRELCRGHVWHNIQGAVIRYRVTDTLNFMVLIVMLHDNFIDLDSAARNMVCWT